MDEISHYISLFLGFFVSIPSGIYMFKECFSDFESLNKQIHKARGSERIKLLKGEFTKAVNHQFIEFKLVFVIAYPIIVFLLVYIMTIPLVNGVMNYFERI